MTSSVAWRLEWLLKEILQPDQIEMMKESLEAEDGRNKIVTAAKQISGAPSDVRVLYKNGVVVMFVSLDVTIIDRLPYPMMVGTIELFASCREDRDDQCDDDDHC